MQYAGAYNPLYFQRDGKIQQVTADKQSIGDAKKPYTNHMFVLQPGDVACIFTDGYADQFGGEKGKKYKYKRFKELLLKNAGLDLKKQKANISSEFFEWKAGFEQIDDVCVMGVKV